MMNLDEKRFGSTHGKSTPLTFVLPIALADTGRPGSDLLRLQLLLETFTRFFDRRDLAAFLLITRPEDIESLRTSAIDLPDFVQICDETDLCPCLASNPDTFHSFPVLNRGWIRQQLLKLAIASHVTTDFYMTLDSDVLFTQPFSSRDLIHGGRSIVNTHSVDDFRSLFTDHVAADSAHIRYERDRRASQLLGLGRRATHFYGETPVVLSTSLVRALQIHLGKPDCKWDEWLVRNIPWTEYSLYFTFAEGTQSFEQHHIQGDVNAVMRLTDSLWYQEEAYRVPHTIKNWTWAAKPRRDGVAVVVQSYLGYDVATVRDRYLELTRQG
jgi:hypothetical protein